jgi:hypothetical protein
VQRAHQVGAVVLGHLGAEGEGLRDVGVVSLVVLTLDGEDVHPVIADQVRGHVVLGGQRVGGTKRDLGAGRPERAHQVRRLAGDMETGGEFYALQRPFSGETGADLPQYRHGALGPFGAAAPLVGEGDVLDVVPGVSGLNRHSLLSERRQATA